jgi:hypothetical protein
MTDNTSSSLSERSTLAYRNVAQARDQLDDLTTSILRRAFPEAPLGPSAHTVGELYHEAEAARKLANELAVKLALVESLAQRVDPPVKRPTEEQAAEHLADFEEDAD